METPTATQNARRLRPEMAEEFVAGLEQGLLTERETALLVRMARREALELW